jgi:hypothetical protein
MDLSRGLGDVYKRQMLDKLVCSILPFSYTVVTI